MDVVLLIFGIILIIVGIIGCLVPVLPGPPLSYVGLILLHFSKWGQEPADEKVLTPAVMIALAVIVVVVTVIDYIIPIWGTKKFGGSKYGIRGATVGLIIGLFLGPVGIIVGPLAGAIVGELIFRDDLKYAVKAGFGSVLGFLAGIGLKLAASLAMTVLFLVELFRN